MQKMKVDGVLKQVKLEAQACKALSARIDSETVMQEKLRSDSKNKEEVLRDMAESLEAQVAVLQAGVTEAKQKLSSRQQSIVTLQERITAVVAEHKKLCQELQLKIDENLLPLEKQMKTVDESHGFQLASVAEKSRTINENISKMNGTWAMLQRNLVTAEDTVNTLNATMDTIQEQLDREQSFVRHVLDSTTEVQGRIQDKTAQHENYLQKRHAILGQQKKDLASSVEKNRKLALQYRQQQNEHLLTKACYIQTFDERWYFQLTNNDLKQILMLENRFRVNTDKYNSLRQHLHTMEIQQYGASSACNSQAVHHLEKAIMDATQSMTERVREELHIHSLKYRRNIKNLANTEPIPPIKTYCSVPVQEHLIVQNTYAGNKLAENVTPVQN
ncbi:PREDICTED: GRIP and coiled-coil domain-containing protein 1-like [Priapulus caudatus]|uniref:GRIP and coiled-coil domain-containing protein 1-like n=1 Tax=Priapulus caudatus TaxID=37621 RepID=A0ABM1E1U2_PRICU|nr:PREDICTED: GRIP and coiled-coil domain-containing protein 1-like [Priapulus caudatus]